MSDTESSADRTPVARWQARLGLVAAAVVLIGAIVGTMIHDPGANSSGGSALSGAVSPLSALSGAVTTRSVVQLSELESTARFYVQAFLTGSATDVNRWRSIGCPPFTDTDLVPIRTTAQAAFGQSLDTVRIRGVRTRSAANDQMEAVVDLDLPGAVAGNDNWIAYVSERGAWRATDCSKLPFGGQSSQGISR